MKKIYFPIIIILLIGMFLRLAVLLMNNSLWQDEVPVASFLVNNDWSTLTQPILNGEIIAPLGFLYVVKLLGSFLGYNEYILRLYPFICGLLSLYLVYDIAKKLTTSSAAIWAILLFAISYYVVGYSAECKQYSSDIFSALLIFRYMLWLKAEKISISQLIVIIIIAAVSVWFSFTAVFLLFSLCFVYLIQAISQRNDRRIREMILIIISWVISLMVYFDTHLFQSLSRGGHVHLHNWWVGVGGFPRFVPFYIDSLIWPLNAVLNLFDKPIGLYPSCGFALFIIGVLLLYRKNRLNCFLLITPVIVAFMVGFFNIYPFMSRSVIYLLPLVLMVIGDGISETMAYIRKYSKVGMVLLVVLVMGKPVSLYMGTFIRHPDGSREAIEYLLDNIKPGETVMVGRYSKPHFNFYTKGKCLEYTVISMSHPILLPSDVLSGPKNEIGFKKYLTDLSELIKNKKRIWLFINDNTLKEKECIFSFLSDKGDMQLKYSNKYAYVFIYEPK